MNLTPDFVSDIRLNWTHRRLPDAELYFIVNPRSQAVLAKVQLCGLGKPERWHPETGEITPITAFQNGSRSTRLMLPLGATESVFVILRQSSEESRSDENKLVRLTKEGKQCFDLTKPIGNITVTSAKYGTPEKTVDVKSIVEKLVGAGERRIPVNRIAELRSAPASDAVNTLTIDYEMDGKNYTARGKDTETLVLGTMLLPVKVQNAKFAHVGETTSIDIQERLQNFLDRGENNFSLSWLCLPDDPVQERFWSLTFDYEVDGKTGTWEGQGWNSPDGAIISLEGKVPSPAGIPAQNSAGQSCIDFIESGTYEVSFASGKKRTETVSLPEPLNLDDNWNVTFPHKTVTFDKLASWSESADETIKFFSGTATYDKTFIVPANLLQSGLRMILDLGKTEIMAQLELNGNDLGVLWKTEKTIDVTERLKIGDNRLKISVTNGWANRLIGDAALPPSDERHENGSLKAWPQWLLEGKPDPNGRSTFCMWNVWKADDAPIPSGLIGPVRLQPIKRVVVE